MTFAFGIFSSLGFSIIAFNHVHYSQSLTWPTSLVSNSGTKEVGLWHDTKEVGLWHGMHYQLQIQIQRKLECDMAYIATFKFWYKRYWIVIWLALLASNFGTKEVGLWHEPPLLVSYSAIKEVRTHQSYFPNITKTGLWYELSPGFIWVRSLETPIKLKDCACLVDGNLHDIVVLAKYACYFLFGAQIPWTPLHSDALVNWVLGLWRDDQHGKLYAFHNCHWYSQLQP